MTNPLDFHGKCSCFTGKLAELTRTAVERETRARGGLTTKVVNGQLDYLVVGSIPANGWKHGNYGRKIESAQALILEGKSNLMLIPEGRFMEALAFHLSEGSGEPDSKMAVLTYRFTAPDRKSFDRPGLEQAIVNLRERHGFHVRASSFFVNNHQALFRDTNLAEVPDSYLAFEVRFVKQLEVDREASTLAADVSGALDPLDGVDGKLSWFERVAGTAGYVRLLREVPEELKVVGP